MTTDVDPSILEAIAREARQCFLEEDAPDYLATLQKSLQDPQKIDFPPVLRAAHSIKGGAGLAQLPGLSKLAHKLEDLLGDFQKERIPDLEVAWELVQRTVNEIGYVLDQAAMSMTADADPMLIQMLEEYHAVAQSMESEEVSEPQEGSLPSVPPGLLKSALEVDLEGCLQRLEGILKEYPESSPQLIKGLKGLAEECTLLAEALDIEWLGKCVADVDLFLDQSDPPIASFSQMLIEHIRQERTQFLALKPLEKPVEKPLEKTLEKLSDSFVLEELSSEATPSVSRAGLAKTMVRVPLNRVENMADLVGELIIRFEGLSLQQQQLKLASQELLRLSQQFQPIRDQVQTIYDQTSLKSLQEGSSEFDPLEMDRYTSLHRSLQTFEELITRIQETRSDIDLLNREFADNLELGRKDLDQLYTQVTRTRLIPFQTIAQRFIPQLSRLCQRLKKKAELVIEGSEVLVDQMILEQLQTPLTHLLNNAMDHGVESPEERKTLEKSPVAQITLKAVLEGNQVVITFSDDGRGINLTKVYQKALKLGLCPANVTMAQLKREQILDFLFQSGFSTASQVSDVSGRGVGLDVVRQWVSQLQGSLQVDFLPGQGTTFTIRLPLGLSLLSLMLCQSQRRLMAIPSTSVLEIMPYDEVVFATEPDSAQVATMSWREQDIPLVPFASLLPYAEGSSDFISPRVVIVLAAADSPVAIALDALLAERQLIIKPFDETIIVPPYVAGCTILGRGDVVPVFLPYYFSGLIRQIQTLPPAQRVAPATRTILIAEDSVATRRAIERILSQAGYAVIACRDGQEALDELRQRQGAVDMILTDIEMPRLTGFELLQAVRTHSQWYVLPVALLTSRTGDRHRQRALTLGASSYLSKPVDPSVLLNEIEQILNAK
jgi:chemotaxis protein histidine kinase CheA/CheY-like chemotaxis protein